MEKQLRIAVQKSGRLSEKTKELMTACGLDYSNGGNQLFSKCYNFPVEFLYLRDDDIPGYVADGVADAGIVGLNEVEEKQQHVVIAHHLGFAKCRLSVAVPNNFVYNSVNDLNGKRIATSYPNILQKFLEKNNIKAEIHEISGSVEIAPKIGLTDVICDLVSSGSTLISNGLVEKDIVLESDAVLIHTQNLEEAKLQILNKLLIRIQAVKRANHNKYILLNAPENAVEKIIPIIPGMKSPTIVPLAEKGWVSVHSVVHEDDFWEIIERLRDAGAQGILVVPIEKMIF